MRTLVAATLLAAAFAGLYEASDAVVQLTDKDFSKKTSEGVWLVEVFADWCGHCKAAAPAVKQAAKALKGVASIGVVDGDKNSGTAQQLGVKGFPTFKMIVDGKSADYNGPRDAAGMADAVLKEVQGLVRKRLGGKSGGGGGGSKPSGGKPSGGQKGANEPGGGKHVIAGTASNFDEVVLGASEPVLVEFYAPWCGHCKSLAGPLADAAAELAGEIKVVAVDAQEHASIGSEYGVKGFPTLKFFPAGKKSAASAQDYNGGRSKDELVAALRGMVEATGGGGSGAGSAEQLTGGAQWAEACAGKKVCVLAVLPQLLDEGAARRAERIETLAEAAGKVGRRATFSFFWSEVGAQPALEAALNVGLVPAVFAVSLDKKIYMPYRGPLDAAHLTKWLKALNESPVPFPPAGLPAVADAPAWDGKDAAATSAEDEISLEELGL